MRDVRDEGDEAGTHKQRRVCTGDTSRAEPPNDEEGGNQTGTMACITAAIAGAAPSTTKESKIAAEFRNKSTNKLGKAQQKGKVLRKITSRQTPDLEVDGDKLCENMSEDEGAK